MTPTTIRELRAAFITVIKAITPSQQAHRERGWSAVASVDEVPSTALRRFFVSFRGAAAVTSGIYSPDSHERSVTLRVYASYFALPEDDFEDLVGDDGNDLFLALDTRRDPIIAGLVSVEELGWVDEDEENGQRWGAHEFEVRYLAHGAAAS